MTRPNETVAPASPCREDANEPGAPTSGAHASVAPGSSCPADTKELDAPDCTTVAPSAEEEKKPLWEKPNWELGNPSASSSAAEGKTPQWQLGYYYGKSMSSRTKRWATRRGKKESMRPVRPLLTLLLDVLQDFQSYIQSIKVSKPASEIDATARLEAAVDETSEDKQSAECFDLHDYCATVDRSHGEGTLLEILESVIMKRLPAKAKYLSRKILFESEQGIGFLLDCPDVLETEVEAAFQASKQKRTARRRRGRRGGKRINKAEKSTQR